MKTQVRMKTEKGGKVAAWYQPYREQCFSSRETKNNDGEVYELFLRKKYSFILTSKNVVHCLLKISVIDEWSMMYPRTLNNRGETESWTELIIIIWNREKY